MNLYIDIGNTNVLNAGNLLVAAIYESSAPAVLVQSQQLPTPYGGQIRVTFTNLEPVVYNFVLYESANGTPTGIIRLKYSLQPTQQAISVRPDLYLVADASAELNSGSLTYNDPTLSGWQYSLESVGAGTLQPDVDYTTTDTSWTLTDINVPIVSGQKFVIRFVPQVSDSSPAIQSSKIITGQTIITANTTLDNTSANQMLVLQGAFLSLSITLPLISSLSDGAGIYILSAGGSHINAIINTNGQDIINWQLYQGQSNCNQIIIGQSEQLFLMKWGTVFYVMPGTSDTIKMTGDILYQYAKLPMNTMLANGALLARVLYPRLFAYIQNLESNAIASEAQWASTDGNGNRPYIGLFTMGDGQNTFRIPQLYAYGYLSAVDGVTRKIGSFSPAAVGAHEHNYQDTFLTTAANNYSVASKYPNSQQAPSPNSGQTPSGMSSIDNVSASQNKAIYSTKTTTIINAGVTKPADIGIYALIRF